MKTRKTPLRMCLGCGEMKPKRELIRVVRGPDETIALDATGKMPGRGAYICPCAECLTKAQKGRRLEKTFSCRIDDAVYANLQQMLTEVSADE